MMKNNYFKKCMACLVMLLVAGASLAASYPKYPVQTLTDGQTYVLVNLANPIGYMCRTTWDNALVMQDKSAFNTEYGVKLTAHFNEEKGLWSFSTSETEGASNGLAATISYTYLGIPSGTNNVRAMQQFEEVPYFEVTPGIIDGFYKLRVAEGHQHNLSIGVLLHLNAGGTYPIANEPTNGWYPDFYGGVAVNEDGEAIITYDEETGLEYKQMADSTSCNWGFVAVEDIDAYNQTGAAWKEINDFAQSNFCSDGSEYEAGFKLSLEAAMKLMEEGNMEAAAAIIAAKKELHAQIEAALILQEETSDLDGAIEKAVEAFNTKTDAEEVRTVAAALKKACNDYQMGLGYITSGVNMSFEDLSAQGGVGTGGVAGAPAGWNVTINGKPAQTADAVRAAGITAWHGVNDDSDGYKDGNNSFGLWNGSVPEYELSQTITGLDNGSYTITCGLMVGANGNGSRRTTQRLFGNYNSTLFANDYDYADGILPGELKEYAGLEELTTDRTMQEIRVRAYVYDGTLTFGIRTNGDIKAALRESANGAGGDGWFKVDNFTIYKEGFIQEDQHNLYDFLAAALSEVAEQPMDKNYKEMFDNYDDSDLDKAIAEINGLIAIAQAQADAYKQLEAALLQAEARLESCIENGYKGIKDMEQTIQDVRDNYYDGEYTAEQIEGVVAALEQAYQDCLHSGADEGADMSEFIVNRSFEDLRNQMDPNSGGIDNVPYGWTLKLNGVEVSTPDEIRAQGVVAWCAVNQGDNINVEENGVVYNHQYTDGTHVWGIWNASIPEVELSQKITGLNPGTYVLTADVMARNTDWSGVNHTTQRIFAQDVICMYGTENDYDFQTLADSALCQDMVLASKVYEEGIALDEEEGYEYLNFAGHDAYNNDILLRTLELHFAVDESGEATIGFRTNNIDSYTGMPRTEQAAGWFKLDNFTLYYESSKVPENIGAGIHSATVPASRAIYDLSGRRVGKAQKGVYIMQGRKVVK